MKTGVIVYTTGKIPQDWTEEKEFNFLRSETQADDVEIITSQTGHFDVIDAWLNLTQKGMSPIVCKIAHFDAGGELKYTGSQLRLAG